MRRVPMAFLAAALLAAKPAPAAPLIVQGSTTLSSLLMVPHQEDIEQLSGQKLVVVPNKSSLGLQALIERNAQLGMISGPLAVEVSALAKILPSSDLGKFRDFEIARTRMAFAVHPANPLRTITRAQMRRILTGEVRNWRDVGGQNLPIRLVIVREGGGVQASVESQLLNGQKVVAPDPILVQISSQVVKITLQEPGALGLAQYGAIKKAGAFELKLDEPVEQILGLVTFNAPTPEMQSVIDATRTVAAKALD